MVLYSVGQKKYNFSEVIDEIPMVFDSRYTPQQPFYKLPQYGFKLTEEILSRFIDFSLESDTLSGKPNRNPVSTPVESFSTSLCTLATVDAEECDDDKWSIDKLSREFKHKAFKNTRKWSLLHPTTSASNGQWHQKPFNVVEQSTAATTQFASSTDCCARTTGEDYESSTSSSDLIKCYDEWTLASFDPFHEAELASIDDKKELWDLLGNKKHDNDD